MAVQDLFIIDADGTDERDLSNAVGDEVDPVWSPDGRMLAYLHWAGPTRRVEVTEVDGSAGPVPAGPEAERVSWSPDSTTLLYSTSDTLATVDAAFREEPVVLASDGPIACSSWRPGPP